MKNKSTFEKILPYAMIFCMLTFIAACGSDDDDSGGGGGQQQQQQQDEGTYQVTFAPVNTEVGAGVLGTGTISIAGDEVNVEISVNGAPAARHSQQIRTGSSCAGIANDANGDGFVDAVESNAVSGQILIPLDSNLGSQQAGNSYPVGSIIRYSESTSLALMLADLQAPDEDPADNVVKLGAGDSLNLEGKVIEIRGVPASTSLPETVVSDSDEAINLSLPIACGVITRGGGTTGGTTGGTSGGTTGGTSGGTTGGTSGGTGGSTIGGMPI